MRVGFRRIIRGKRETDAETEQRAQVRRAQEKAVTCAAVEPYYVNNQHHVVESSQSRRVACAHNNPLTLGHPAPLLLALKHGSRHACRRYHQIIPGNVFFFR